MRKKVLVLEDEDNIRGFVVINLRRAGYDTVEFALGEEAYAYLREKKRRLSRGAGRHAARHQRIRGLPSPARFGQQHRNYHADRHVAGV